MKEESKNKLSPEQIKREVMMQLANISKTLKKETRALPLNMDQHEKISTILNAFDQTMQDYMIACDNELSILNTRMQELRESKKPKKSS